MAAVLKINAKYRIGLVCMWSKVSQLLIDICDVAKEDTMGC